MRELDITATDLATNVIQDIEEHLLQIYDPKRRHKKLNMISENFNFCFRVPGLTWLSAGQLDGMNDEVRRQLLYCYD